MDEMAIPQPKAGQPPLAVAGGLCAPKELLGKIAAPVKPAPQPQPDGPLEQLPAPRTLN